MKFLVVLSVVLAVTLAAPANVYSPYFLQDLAYQSVDADQDGKPDTAVAVSHPVTYPYYARYSPYYGAPTVAISARSGEALTPLSAAYGYPFAPYQFASYPASTFGYSIVAPFTI